MAETNFSRKLKAKLAESKQILAESLATGSALDYANYTKVVGQIEGLQNAYDMCNELDKEYD